MTAAILEVDALDLDIRRDGATARVLRGVGLRVAAGERVGLVGESGCGKSVLLRTIMGILPMPPGRVTGGTIRFDGRDLLAMPPKERQALKGRDMAMVFQDPMSALNPVFTLGQQMDDILKWGDRHAGHPRPRAARRAHILDTLALCRLPDPARLWRAYPGTLSGGMRQRVLIAMALLNQPRMLLADEPGTALDVTTQDDILRLLDDLVSRQKLALLLVTHNLGVIRGVADTVYVMYAGAVVEHGPTAAIFADPRHPYTRALLACVPKLTGGVMARGIDGTLPDYANPPPGCRFAPRCPQRLAACDAPPPDVAVDGGHAVSCWLYGR